MSKVAKHAAIVGSALWFAVIAVGSCAREPAGDTHQHEHVELDSLDAEGVIERYFTPGRRHYFVIVGRQSVSSPWRVLESGTGP